MPYDVEVVGDAELPCCVERVLVERPGDVPLLLVKESSVPALARFAGLPSHTRVAVAVAVTTTAAQAFL